MLADRVRRLAHGLPAEDELSVILSWLGNCLLIHKLDQMQIPPASKGQYRVPDLLAIFEHQGRVIPVLIEVKKSRKHSISWRPDFFEGLRRYGQVLNLPVLVAWKVSTLGAWLLVDLDRFQQLEKNHKLTLATAMKANLLGLLGGDFTVTFQPGLGMYLHLKKVETVSKEVHGDQTHEQVVLRVTDAYFLTPEGGRITRHGHSFWRLSIRKRQ